MDRRTVERRRDAVRHMHDVLGMSFAEIGRNLRVTRQRARDIYLDAAAHNGSKWADIDPKDVLPPRIRGTLKRVGLTATEALRTEAWNHVRGLGDGARKLLQLHYG